MKRRTHTPKQSFRGREFTESQPRPRERDLLILNLLVEWSLNSMR